MASEPEALVPAEDGECEEKGTPKAPADHWLVLDRHGRRRPWYLPWRRMAQPSKVQVRHSLRGFYANAGEQQAGEFGVEYLS